MTSKLKNLDKYNLLHNKNALEVFPNPFPHIIIRDALPSILVDELTTAFPINKFQSIKNLNNIRMDLSCEQVLKENDIPIIWKEFIKYHSSSEFFYKLVDLFRDFIDDDAKSYIQSLKKDQIGIRNINKNKKIYLDAQISVNSPVFSVNSVRECHVDSGNKLYSGLFYLRQDNDFSNGGDLQLCKWKDGISHDAKLKLYREGLSKNYFDVYNEIKYEKNVAIFFINSLDSLHLVTPRNKTNQFRTFANFVAEAPIDFYQKETSFRQNFNKILANTIKIIKRVLRFKKNKSP